MLSAPTSYVDFDSLAQLRTDAAHDSASAIDEAAIQFEAMMIGMMLKSARQAKLGEGLFDSDQSQQYMELMDGQVSLELARRGTLGLGAMVAKQLETQSVGSVREVARAEPAPTTPESFVRRYRDEATVAAEALGIDPKLLLAQVALETGWGKSLPQRPDGVSSNNLFGIKAGQSWTGPRVSRWTMEFSDGIAERKLEAFRAYANTAESFADYVDLVSGSYRYDQARASVHNSEAYARELAAGGYATDPEYADKWMAIYRSETLK